MRPIALGAIACLFGAGSRALAQMPTVHIDYDERYYDVYTTLANVVTDEAYVEVDDGSTANETLHAALDDGMDAASADTFHHSEANPGRILVKAAVSSESSATFRTNYSHAESYVAFIITVSQPTMYSLDGFVSSAHNGDHGSSSASVSLFRTSDGTPVFGFYAFGTDNVPTVQAGILPAGQYTIEISCAVNLLEIENESVSGAAAMDVTLSLGDRDGDGLLDVWEEHGIDVDGDEIVDLDLPAMGASPDRKDIFVEVDAMVGREPQPEVIPELVAAFSNAPVYGSSPAYPGIALHVVVDETGLPLADFPNDMADLAIFKAAHYGTPGERASPNWTNIRDARVLAFHYCAFANNHGDDTSSGLGEYPGNDFMITFGGWAVPGGTAQQQAGTFMHELGHNLGLGHGGFSDLNYKPNYVSVMNYRWTTPHTWSIDSWRLDYSREAFPTLDETRLSENLGIRATDPVYAMLMIPFTSGSGWGWAPARKGLQADWNNDHMPTPGFVAVDINREKSGDPSNPAQAMGGFDDWQALRYHLTGNANYDYGVTADPGLDEYTAVNQANDDAIPAPPNLCVADLDGDGDTDVFDFGVFAVAFGTLGAEPYTAGDFDGDGNVDVFDFGTIAVDLGCVP